MNNQQITTEISHYLHDQTYQYAVLIDGEWGCGKTFFVKNELTTSIKEDEQVHGTNRKVRYISLYGLKNVEEIQAEIAISLLETLQEKKHFRFIQHMIKKFSGTIINSVKSLGLSALKQFAGNWGIPGLAADWSMMKSYIFIFDDLERCDCTINEVFGLLNKIVEHENTKVILIANEKEISSKVIQTSKELQYILVLDSKIEFPKDENPLSRYVISPLSSRQGKYLKQVHRYPSYHYDAADILGHRAFIPRSA